MSGTNRQYQKKLKHSKSNVALTLVAEDPAPALVAVALPGLVAPPVLAARVQYALVAVSAFPTHLAPGKNTRENIVSKELISNHFTNPSYINVDYNVNLTGVLFSYVLKMSWKLKAL